MTQFNEADSPVVEEPIISIIMTFKNSEPFLPKAIESILNQTEQRFIIYAINDGSTDNGEKYLATIKDERLVLLSPGNIGYVKALNLGIDQVRTPLIAICDSDDIYVKTRLETQLNFLDLNKDHVLVGANINYFGTSSNKKWQIRLPNKNEEIKKALFKGLSAIMHSTIMMRTEIIKKIGGYKEKYFPAPDYHLFFELSKYGKLANINEVLANVRLHKTSIMSNNLYEGLLKYEESRRTNLQCDKEEVYDQRKYLGLISNFFLRLKRLEFKGVTYYRKGIFYYVNNSTLKAILFLCWGALISPRRSVVFITRLFRNKLCKN